MRAHRVVYLIFCLSGVLFGCSSGDAESSGASDEFQERDVNSLAEGDQTSFDESESFGGSEFLPAPLPEQERDISQFLSPQTSKDYIFIANETLDTVSQIHVDQLSINSISVCDQPIVLKTIQTQNLAIVLCKQSDELEVIRVSDEDQKVYTHRVRLPPRMNRLSLSPDGNLAFAYYQESVGDPLGSVQMIAAIPLDSLAHSSSSAPSSASSSASSSSASSAVISPKVFQLSVGFYVQRIEYRTIDGILWAFVITDSGVSPLKVHELTESQPLRLFPITIQPDSGEVLLSKSGRYMITREWERQSLKVTRFEDAVTREIPMTSVPTDIDTVYHLEEDLILVMLREEKRALLLNLGDLLDVEEEDMVSLIQESIIDQGAESDSNSRGVASVSEDGRWVLMYSTLEDQDLIHILDLQGEYPPQVQSLRKKIESVHISPDHQFALIIHPAQIIEERALLSPADQLIWEDPAYSILTLKEGYSRLIPTNASVSQLTFWSGAQELDPLVFLLFEDTLNVDQVNLRTFTVTSEELGSLPTSLGTTNERRQIWINQDHSLGRISFWDLDREEVQTVTGFELNRQVQ